MNSIDQMQSCHILPMDSSNFYHDHDKYNVKGKLDHSSSAYTEDKPISIQEDREDDDDEKSQEASKNKRGQQLRTEVFLKGSRDGGEDDPEVENAKLLQKHAQ